MIRYMFLCGALFAHLPAAAQQTGAPAAWSYDRATTAFAEAAAGPALMAGDLRGLLPGRLYSSDAQEPDSALLVGSDVGRISGEVINAKHIFLLPPAAGLTQANAGLFWRDSEYVYEARKTGSYVIVSVQRADHAAGTQYGVFEFAATPLSRENVSATIRESSTLQAVSSGHDPFNSSENQSNGSSPANAAPVQAANPQPVPGAEYRSGLNANWIGSVDYRSGNTPILNRNFTKPYVKGPGGSSEIGFELNAKNPNRWFPGVELHLRQQYLTSMGSPEARMDFLHYVKIAINDFFMIDAFHRISPDLNEPPGYSGRILRQTLPLRFRPEPSTLLQQTAVGFRLAPFGRFAKSGVEWFFDISEIPGGSKTHIGPNNWPSRIRGAGNPLGWETGADAFYTFANPWKIPFTHVRLGNPFFATSTTIRGSTPFDNPSSLGVLAEFGVPLKTFGHDNSKHLYFKITSENILDLDYDVRADPPFNSHSMTRVNSGSLVFDLGHSNHPHLGLKPCEAGCFH